MGTQFQSSKITSSVLNTNNAKLLKFPEYKKDIPNGDVLIHAGDFTNTGSVEEIVKFNDEIGRLPHKHKIVVAGNHELGFDDSENLSERLPQYIGEGTTKGYNLLTNATWLHDNYVKIDGVIFFGSSWHPLYGYPFYTHREKLKEKWAALPSDLHVLITHTPALGYEGFSLFLLLKKMICYLKENSLVIRTLSYLDKFGTERWGCRHLLSEIENRIKPKFHVFGHVHECYGALSNARTIFINAAQASKDNKIVNKPLVFYISKELDT
ncbi:Ser/Thr phosphatase family protein [Dictyocaulus viviparus]|uniref:Ser/Thr phosphatase family protein n=1 Tax=Dictyocaulus viviparus TaxID=29172 RepID=A0A0D8XRB2_DICVI|nr:Ser/Thr phosphatase family protein [Dictyocaulus viviparus]